MERKGSKTRPSSLRKPLSDGIQRANVSPSSPKSDRSKSKMEKRVSSSPQPTHHDSLMPNRPLSVKTAVDSPLDNKRLSTITTEDQTESKRDSQVSTTSTNASAKGRKIKTHIGPWELGSDLGKGGCGKVRKVRHCETGETAAVKIISKKKAEEARAESLMNLAKHSKRPSSVPTGNVLPCGVEREVVIMKLLEHPNVVKLYDVWENRHELYLIMEYVEGGELFDYIANAGFIYEDETVWLFRQMLAALIYCDRLGIHHRDLKPENILLDPDTKEVKLVDFGMAALQPKGLILTTACGSINYAAPEVFERRYDGAKVDVWSLGIILYLMLTGTVPFIYDQKKPLQQWCDMLKSGVVKESPWDELSEEAADLIAKMLNPDPKKRITLEGAWAHPFLHKYADEWDESAEKRSLEYWIGERPMIWDWNLRHRSDIDPEILHSLRTLWHSVKEGVLIEKLLNTDANQEKYFYSALERHRDEQLENYNALSVGLDHSTTDYQHIKRPMRLGAAESPSSSKSRRVSRTKSQFSILNDEHLQSRSSIMEPPNSERSYDPYRSSKENFPKPKDGYASIKIYRSSSSRGDMLSVAQIPQKSSSLRVEALKNEQRRLSIVSSSASFKAVNSRGASRISNTRSISRSSMVSFKAANGRSTSRMSHARSISKSSLGSSLVPSSPPVFVRPSLKHKRPVVFSHLHRSSTTSAITTQDKVATPDRNNRSSKRISADIRDPLSSPSIFSDNPVVSKKENAGALTPRTLARRSASHSEIINSEARKVSIELKKYIEQRFNRSSTVSSNTTSATATRSTYDTPPSSISNHESSQSTKTPTTPLGPQRPLPDAPSDTPRTFLARELIETRRRLAARAAADSGVNDQAYTRTLAQLDAMIESSPNILDRRRVFSSPEQRNSDFFSTLPAISEEDKTAEPDGVRTSRDNVPDKTKHDGPMKKATTSKRWDHRDPETTIRIIEPSSPTCPAPLQIRKASGATTVSRRPTPLDTSLSRYNGSATMLAPKRVSSVADSALSRYNTNMTIGPPKRVSTPTSPTYLNIFDVPASGDDITTVDNVQPDQTKRRWWKRKSPTMAENHQSPIGQRRSNDHLSSAKPGEALKVVSQNTQRATLDAPSPTNSGLKGKRPGFLKFLWKAPKYKGTLSGPRLGADSPDTPTSTDFSTSTSERSRGTSRYNHSLEQTEFNGLQDLGVQRNWLARFLNIRPATRILCFHATRGRARQQIHRLLVAWRQYGIVDLIVDKERNLLFGRVDEVNTLGLKEVEFVVELFVVLQENQRKGISAARFTQRKGAASSLRRLVSELEARMEAKGMMLQDKSTRKEIEAVINEEAAM